MMWLYKVLLIVLVLGCGYLIYSNVTLSKKNKDLLDSVVEKEKTEIVERQKLIDSIVVSKMVITKDLLSNQSNIKKLKEELSKTNRDSMTIEEALKLLNIQ